MLRLRVSSGSEQRVVEVSGERFVIGREVDDVDLAIDDEEVSRRHAALRELADGRLEIEDLGSRNGTHVDGNRISGPVTLSGGEALRLGTTTISVEQPRAAETRPTPAAPPPTVAGEPPVTVVGTPPGPPPPPPPSATAMPPVPPDIAPTTPVPASATPTVALQGDSLQPPPPGAAPIPAAPKRRPRGRLTLAIVAAVFALAGAAAIAYVLIDDDDSSGSWDSAFVEERQQACESTGNSVEACGCFVDELEASFTQEEYEQVLAQVESGLQNENVSRRAELAGECGVNLG